MTIAEKRKAMSKSILGTRKKLAALDDKTRSETLRYLKDLRSDLRMAVVGAEGWEARYLAKIQDTISQSIRRFEGGLSATVSANQDVAWDIGSQGVDSFISSGGILAKPPALSNAQLLVLRDFSADLITDLAREALAKVNSAVALGVVGARSPYETMKEIDKVLGTTLDKGVTARAEKIARTEVGRVQAVAGQLRMEQMQTVVPELKKQWITGINARDSHAEMDGQVKPADEPFELIGRDGNTYYPMEPRDPLLPAEEVVNCNCDSIPYLEGVE